jgi:hypothetical protein
MEKTIDRIECEIKILKIKEKAQITGDGED